MSRARKLLIFSGIALVILGMCYGLWYALFTEHQRLDQIGGALAASFAQATDRNLNAAHASLQTYGEVKYVYVREVDVHSHWAGLALLLILLGAAFDRIGFSKSRHFWLALALVIGSVGFPASVLLENFDHGSLPRILAVITSTILIIAMMLIALGFMMKSERELP